MVAIRTHVHSPRLTYAADLVFKHVLGVQYYFLRINDYNASSNIPIVNYTNHPVYQGISVPTSTLLEETDIRPQKFNIYTKEIPLIFFQPQDQRGTLDFDIFAATFYLATEYEKWANPCYDDHDRYEESYYISYQQQWYEQPLVHLYAEMLWEKLIALYPNLTRKKRKYSFTITFDVDHPWKFLHKPLHVRYGGLVKDLVTRNWDQATERMQVMASKKDPNDTFDLIFANCYEESTKFFFLIDRNSTYDSRFDHRNIAYRQLIQHINILGYEIGIHPSYTTYLQPDRIWQEAQSLSEIVKGPIKRSRQHFLKYRLPNTFRGLIAAGIEYDYTICNYQTGGFRTGISVRYPWFDLESNEITDLWIQPTLIMDVTLNKYLQLSPSSAVDYVKSLVEKTKKVNGHFTILLHNDALSNTGMWKGWRKAILSIINYLQTNPNGIDHY